MAFFLPRTPAEEKFPDPNLRVDTQYLLREHFGPLVAAMGDAVDADDMHAVRTLAADLSESAAALEQMIRRG